MNPDSLTADVLGHVSVIVFILSLLLPCFSRSKNLVLGVAFFGNLAMGCTPLLVPLFAALWFDADVWAGELGIGKLLFVPFVATLIAENILL